MRRWLLVLGIVLVLLGAVLIFVPLFGQSLSNVDGTGSMISSGVPAAYTLKSYGISYYLSFTWSSSVSTTFTVLSCANFDTTTLTCNGPATLGSQSGTGGTLSVTAPPGATLELTTSGPNTAFSWKASSPLLGLLVVSPGLVGVMLGVASRSPRKRVTPATSDEPPTPPPTTPPG
jgi:hypothetical protein